MKLPLELRLIIYEHFDPKDKSVIVDDIDNGIGYPIIYIKSDEHFIFDEWNNLYVIIFYIQLYNYNYNIPIYLRKSQVNNFRNKLT